jgi:GDP-L-fucose synthase
MKVLVTGGSGLVGTAFSSSKIKGFDWEVVPSPSQGGVNFLDRRKTFEFFNSQKVDAVVHTAAKVGGIKANMTYPHEFYSENIQINTNVLDAAKNAKIKKCISFLSTCIYPDNSTYPLQESNIHNGSPHKSNMFYAYAKRMLDIHSQAISKQKGFNYFCVSPNNLYGINDNFDPNNSHVIPGIILKAYEASNKNKRVLSLWGDGTPKREFTFANDIPDIIAFLLKKKNIEGVINIGNSSREYSISEVANDILSILELNLRIKWESKKMNGQDRKPSSSEKMDSLKYDTNYTNLRLGLKKTTKWFLENYPKIRGID